MRHWGWSRVCCWCAGLLIASASATYAADIKTVSSKDGQLTIITVEGEFQVADGEKFAHVASGIQRGAVMFASPGGALIAGLQMGKIIRLHHFATFVGQDNMCASACALAWLAGKPLIMQEGSQIGFHAASIEKAGERVGSNVGNALMGAYLSELGLSYQAIIYIETADPDDITWLTMRDAHKIGLHVKLVARSNTPPPPPESHPSKPTEPTPAKQVPTSAGRSPSLLAPELSAPSPESDPGRTIEAVARTFVEAYFSHWSETSREALTFFQGAYAKQVKFYGKDVDRETVLAGKRNFTEKWPARVYSTQPDTLHVFCNQATRTCTISGVVNWDCRNPHTDTTTKGSANFILTANLATEQPEILAENGSVISRSVN